SAGADPGPACYGRGGQLPTVSDACLLMGILDAEGFAGGEMRLDEQLARRAFERLDSRLPFDQRVAFAYRIAVTNIAEEITNVAIRHGVDPRDFSVIAYGAAGPMLLPAALDVLHVRRVVVPPHPGLFSALGLLSTDLVFSSSRSAYVTLGPDTAGSIAVIFADMEQELWARVGEAVDIRVRRSFDGRLLGQSWETPFVDVPDGPITESTIGALVDRFHDAYESRFGNRFPTVPVQGVTYRVQLVVPAEKVEYEPRAGDRSPAPRPERVRELRYFADRPLPTPEYARSALRVGARLEGPAIIREELSTTFVGPQQVATAGRFAEIIIERAG
ncbi:MAG: hydantoinase/oxoprolinase family protein, partial [Candidatus Dormibacteraeota bacterium]|nr:hydantoinase/oxoprolinase family protein [Candidatus Dormibacteraeota bacterium]